jgi:hypothetical protein
MYKQEFRYISVKDGIINSKNRMIIIDYKLSSYR